MSKKNALRSLLCSYSIFFIDNFGYALAFSLFPLLLLSPQQHFVGAEISSNWRHFYIALVLMSFPLAQIIGAPLFGELSDRKGRRWSLSLTVSGTIIGYALTAVSIHIEHYSLLIISRLFTGFFAGNVAICLAIISDVSFSKYERVRRFSLAAALLGVAWTSAFLFGSHFFEGFNFSSYPPQLTFWVIATLSALAFFLVRTFFQETLPEIEKTKDKKLWIKSILIDLYQAHKEKNLLLMFSVLFFWFLGSMTSLLWISEVFYEKFMITPPNLIRLFITLGVAWTLSSLLNRNLIGNKSIWTVTLWALFLNSLFLFYTASGDYLLYSEIAFTTCALAGGMIWPNLFSFISIEGKEEQQGRVMGGAQAVLSTVEFLGPFLGGFIAAIGVDLLVYCCSFSVLVAFIFLLTNLARRKSQKMWD